MRDRKRFYFPKFPKSVAIISMVRAYIHRQSVNIIPKSVKPINPSAPDSRNFAL